MPVTHHPVFYRPDTLPAAQPTASKHCSSHYNVDKTPGLTMLRKGLMSYFQNVCSEVVDETYCSRLFLT